jgi:hypothetical protein
MSARSSVIKFLGIMKMKMFFWVRKNAIIFNQFMTKSKTAHFGKLKIKLGEKRCFVYERNLIDDL